MARMIMNLKIGTKLAIASVLSILLVGGMIYVQVHGNAAVRAANHGVIRLQTILHNVVDSKAAARGLQIGVREMRHAATPEALQKGRVLPADGQKADKARRMRLRCRSPGRSWQAASRISLGNHTRYGRSAPNP
mgnify:CR=1 FL=1